MPNPFIHLRLHTEYSLVDGVVRIKPLVSKVAELGMPAVAITDQFNLFAMVKFYRAAMAQGIKPIIGVDLWLQGELANQNPSRLVLLVQNRVGYLNLTNLISRAYLEGQASGQPVLQRAWLEGATEGLIALSGARQSDVGQALAAGKNRVAEQALAFWVRLFGDRYYLELQRTGRVGEETYLHAAVALATRFQVPVVATNDVRFLRSEEFEAHEARVCIHQGYTLTDTRRPHNYSEQQYLRSAKEMAECFSDIPEALENTLEIAKRCNIELHLGENFLPEFPVPAGLTTGEYLIEQSRKGLEKRLDICLDRQAKDFQKHRKVYDERLKIELDVILQMGFPGYFLIVADFIKWAKTNHIPVGPGRGSGAGSLVAYVLQITDLDPIVYELLFERFLNPERVSMPDFDIDFCMEGRDRVIEYVGERYGRDKVSQIITYGSMAAKAVVRDVGRVLGHPYGFVDRIAKMIPFELGITLEKALAQDLDLNRVYEEDEEVRALIDLARSLEGITRHAGKHAGGVVIAPSQLSDFSPLYCEPNAASVVTQFDKDDVEAVGLVKFDFLGLRTLTIIDWALQTTNQQRAENKTPPLDITRIPLDDPKAFELLQRCATTAVFQLESRGMKDLIKRLKPDCFEEIVALVALFRPGPLQSGMVDDFIDRKHGRSLVEYPHPDLQPILESTYGVILYQEQVMQIAQVLASYTLGGADLLRRAMGKKKPEEMAKQRDIFQAGAVARGVDKDVATHIFDLMEKFAGYGFNRSHSVAYALVSYQTVWLKAHYPAAFMAATLSADMDNTDKIVILIDECRHMRLKIQPPDINRSEFAFTVEASDTIVYGLGAIKGVGQAAIDSILTARSNTGTFSSLNDLCCRIDLRKANKRVLEALVRSGAMDSLGLHRATLLKSLRQSLRMAEQHLTTQAAGQEDLFGLEMEHMTTPEDADKKNRPEEPEWGALERLAGEKDTLGIYLSGHPMHSYEKELSHFGVKKIARLSPSHFGAGQPSTTAGIVIALRRIQRPRGTMAFLTLDDGSNRLEVAAFGDIYEEYRSLLTMDAILVVRGTLKIDEYHGGGLRMTTEKLYTLEQAREAYAKRLVLNWDNRQPMADGFMIINGLEEALTPYRHGHCAVCIQYCNAKASANLFFGKNWQVKPSETLLGDLRQLDGVNGVQLEY